MAFNVRGGQLPTVRSQGQRFRQQAPNPISRGGSGLSDLLTIGASIAPGIRQSIDQRELEMQKSAVQRANEREEGILRNQALSYNDTFLDNLTDQELVKDARDPFEKVVLELAAQRDMHGQRIFSDDQIAQKEEVIGQYRKWNIALKQAAPQNKRQLEFAIRQQFEDDLLLNQGDPSDLIKLRDAALNRIVSSKTLGVADETALITSARMRNKYGESFTKENAISEIIVQQEARTLGVSLNALTAVNLQLHMSETLPRLNNLGMENVRARTIAANSEGKTLNAAGLETVYQELDALEIQLLGHLDSKINADVKRGAGPVDDQVLERARSKIRSSIQSEKDYYATHTDIAQLKAHNELQLAYMEAGGGAAMDKLRKVLDLTPNGKKFLEGFLQKKGDEKEIFRQNLINLGLPESTVENLPVMFATYMAETGTRQPNPQSVNITGPMAIKLLEGPADVKPAVVSHGVLGLNMMTKNPQDIPGVVKRLTEPGVVEKINKSDIKAKQDFVSTHNSRMKLLLNALASEGLTLSYRPEIDRLEAFKLIQGTSPARGQEGTFTKKVYEPRIQKGFNSIYNDMIKSRKFVGLLPDADAFMEDLAKSAKLLGVNFRHPVFAPDAPTITELRVRSPGTVDPASFMAEAILSGESLDVTQLKEMLDDPEKAREFLKQIPKDKQPGRTGR